MIRSKPTFHMLQLTPSNPRPSKELSFSPLNTPTSLFPLPSLHPSRYE